MFKPFDIHRIGQAIRDRLIDERMIGYLPLANEVFRTGELVGEDGRDEVFGSHSGQLRRHFASAAEARQRKRDPGNPSPAGDEHGRIKERLDQKWTNGSRVQIVHDIRQLKAMGGRQRENDIVFGRSSLKLEVELAAEAFAKGEAPGAVDAASVG